MQNGHDQVREIFLQASEITSPAEREAFIRKACAEDAALRCRVEEMLKLQTEAGSFFGPFEASGAPDTKTLVMDPEAHARFAAEEGPGAMIGRYKLLEQIGEGGFGVVYMAEQMEPVKRRVALKIIKLGMDTREVIARFDAERQALALMDHPNVAHVLDAGATASGRPYFVMELVRGLPITDFCDRNKLSTRERIELFTQVCSAAQHAHSKGVIHRDLKPSNILVTNQDGMSIPKVIDFGIAKAIQKPLTEKTLFTRFGQMIGTPIYMSPEHLSGIDIDTRSDIYSLGVILYELLTGKQPFDLRQLREAGHMEMLRVMQEEDPIPPSTRLTTLGNELVDVAEHRSVNARRLSELLRGDLDWITMKALQKNRSLRYETPTALAEDLKRHLNHEPVTAGPPRLGYRAWKFVQRHHYAVATASGIVISLLVGLIVATYAFLNAREERERAVAAEHTADQQRQVAILEAQRARQKELRTRQISYASDMALGSHALDASNLGRVQSLLRRHASASGTNDLRGWEWRYLWQQCQSAELFQLGTLSNSVLSLAASTDGGLVVASDLDDTLAVWDFPARKLLFQITNSSSALAMSPDAKVLVMADQTIRDLESGRILGRLPGDCSLKKLAFSPDGRLLAGIGMDQLSIWNTGDWSLLGKHTGFPCASMHVGGLAFSRDVNWLVVGTEDGRLHMVDPRNGKVLHVWQGHSDHITALATSPDARLLASGAGYSDDQIKLWRSADGSLDGVLKGHRAWISSLAFSPDGNLLVSGSADQSIRVWNVPTKELLVTFKGHLQEVWCVSFLPDGKTVVSAGKDGTVKAWRLPALAPAPGGLGFTLRDVATVQPALREMAFAPDGREVLGPDPEGWISRWTLPSVRRLGRIEALSSNNLLVASSPKSGLMAAVDDQGMIRVWDFQKQAVATNLVLNSAPKTVSWLGFANEGRSLVSVQEYRHVDQFEVGSWKKVCSWSTDGPELAKLAVSPDGRYLASGGKHPTIYELSTGHVVARIAGHKFFTDAVTFSPDGTLLATGSMDGFAKLWRVGTWQEIGTFSGHLLGIHSLAFSHDGRRLATGSLDREAVKIWDLTTMQEVLNLSSPGDLMWWLSFSPEGSTLLAFGTASGIKCWSAPLLDDIQTVETELVD